ncbi:lytic transglycosylase domain-containing protein [Vibrio coralliilyticus]|uniref:Lytic transglycosylase domain-containing protein n=1 Tax=Vibrio coralliilyticus TaxID=190893 RepID=A0AAP6ZVR2_9VIBR|nr:lytic transglycosylase domain-containing protein [Vibrio coralliilyticus]NOI31845.1 lytic transglycosylase domain-containing protein [Vibrio coralliilyticus]NOJ25289.1 lytic transglycosylase domain-containing protein [Vibrio coralliilyticus]
MRWLFLSMFFWPVSAMSYCYEEAGQRFNVSVPLLKAICFTESSFDKGAINSGNSDGSTDYGLCQINDWWFPKLAKYGITRESLLSDPCENTLVAAWILAGNFEVTSDGWKAVGAYNAGWKKEDEASRQIYIAKVKENLEAMQ